jgi:hypothetical protein
MADADYSALAGALSQNYAPQVRRAVNANSKFLSTIPVMPDTGKNVAWVIELGGEDAEVYSDGADVSTYTTGTKKAATVNWGLYRGNGKVTDLAIDVAGSSLSPADLIDLLGHELVSKARAVTILLGQDVYTGGASNEIVGLDDAIADDNTYAGIDRTSSPNAKFRSLVFDPGSLTTITLTDLRGDLTDIEDESGEMPDLAFVSTDVWNRIANLFDSNRQYQIQTVGSDGEVVLKGGAQEIWIENCRFLRDRFAPANSIYYINSQYVSMRFLRTGMRPAWAADDGADTAIQDNNGPLPIGMRVRKLARTGAAMKFSCQTTLQLRVERPNACGVRRNVKLS